MLGVTINTNRAGSTYAEEEHIIEQLEEYLQRDLFRPEKLESLITMRPGGSVIQVDVGDTGIEVGDERHRVHAHTTLTILHDGSVDLGPMQRRWVQVLSADLRHIAPRGVYVRIDLLDAAHLNYAIKEVTELSDILPAEDGPPAAVVTVDSGDESE